MKKTKEPCTPLPVRSNAGLGDRIGELEKQHGSLRAAAKVLGCDAGYLSRLRSGEKQKEIWLVLDADGEPIHCASWQSACHEHINDAINEHINDAINEHQIEGAEKWKVRQATLVPNMTIALNSARHCGALEIERCALLEHKLEQVRKACA